MYLQKYMALNISYTLEDLGYIYHHAIIITYALDSFIIWITICMCIKCKSFNFQGRRQRGGDRILKGKN